MFWLKCSLAYGIPPDEFRKRITARDYLLLRAAYRQGYLTTQAEQSAIIATVIFNQNATKKEDFAEVDDFLLKVRPKTRPNLLEGFEARKRAADANNRRT